MAYDFTFVSVMVLNIWLIVGFLLGVTAIVMARMLRKGLEYVGVLRKMTEGFEEEADAEAETEVGEAETDVEADAKTTDCAGCVPGVDIPKIADGLLAEKLADFPSPSSIGTYLSSFNQSSVVDAKDALKGNVWKSIGTNPLVKGFAFSKPPIFSPYKGVAMNGNVLKGPDSDQLVPVEKNRVIDEITIVWVVDHVSFDYPAIKESVSRTRIFECFGNNTTSNMGVRVAWVPIGTSSENVALEVVWGNWKIQTWQFRKSMLLAGTFMFTLSRKTDGKLRLTVGTLHGTSVVVPEENPTFICDKVALNNMPCLINSSGTWNVNLYSFMIYHTYLEVTDIQRIHAHFQTFDPVYQQVVAENLFIADQMVKQVAKHDDEMTTMKKSVDDASECWKVYKDVPDIPAENPYRVSLSAAAGATASAEAATV